MREVAPKKGRNRPGRIPRHHTCRIIAKARGGGCQLDHRFFHYVVNGTKTK
jgi:hypothetical protein